MKTLFAVLIVTTRASAGPLSAFLSAPTVITATTTDPANNLYIAGSTAQENLPTTPGAFQTDVQCPTCGTRYDFVAKISSGGNLVFATYLIGFDNGESIRAIALDASQNIYVTGSLIPFQAIVDVGPLTGFIDELSSDGSKLLASTTFTGVQPSAIAIAPSGDVFATGWTAGGGTFKTTPGALLTTNQGGFEAFVIRFDPALTQPIYATLLGGNGNDFAYGIAADAEGQAYVTGTAKVGPSTQDVFVVKLNATGSAFLFAAFFDPNPISTGVGIALDSSGVYVAGVTSGPAGTQFAAKIALDGSSLIYHTILPVADSASIPPLFQIAVDNSGNLMIFSSAGNLVPTTSDSFSPCTSGGPSQFILQLDPRGTARTYGSYLPGGLAIRAGGQVWFSDASGAVNSFNIHDPLPAGSRCVADALTYLSGPIAPGKLVSLFGPGIGPEQPANLQLDASGKVGIYIGGVSVYFDGIAAPLLYAAQNQINAVVPFEVAEAPAPTIVILNNGVPLPGPAVPVVAVAPAFVTTSEGCVAAVNPDGSINSATHPASLGSVILVFGEGAGLMNPAVTGEIGQGASHIVAPVSAKLQESGNTAPLTVLYAGDAPGEVEGVFQLDLQMPDSFNPGKQSIDFTIGAVNSAVCIWIGPHN